MRELCLLLFLCLATTTTATVATNSVRPFVVLKLSRTGSTWLTALLREHPNIQVNAEVLHDMMESGNRSAWVRQIERALRASNSTHSFGVTLNPGQPSDSRAFVCDDMAVLRLAEVVARTDAAVLVLSRANVAKWALSRLMVQERARQRLVSHRSVAETLTVVRVNVSAFRLNLVAMQQWVRERSVLRVADRLGASYTTLFYEHLQTDVGRVLRTLTNAIGVDWRRWPPNVAERVSTVKGVPDNALSSVLVDYGRVLTELNASFACTAEQLAATTPSAQRAACTARWPQSLDELDAHTTLKSYQRRLWVRQFERDLCTQRPDHKQYEAHAHVQRAHVRQQRGILMACRGDAGVRAAMATATRAHELFGDRFEVALLSDQTTWSDELREEAPMHFSLIFDTVRNSSLPSSSYFHVDQLHAMLSTPFNVTMFLACGVLLCDDALDTFDTHLAEIERDRLAVVYADRVVARRHRRAPTFGGIGAFFYRLDALGVKRLLRNALRMLEDDYVAAFEECERVDRKRCVREVVVVLFWAMIVITVFLIMQPSPSLPLFSLV